jgi:hypothetical protein
MKMAWNIRRLVVVLLLGLAPLAAHCQSINVLWYTYAHPDSTYRQTIQKLADVVHTLPRAGGLRWKLTFFGPDTPAPAFGDHNVLVIHSAEAGFTGRNVPPPGDGGPGPPNATPDYRGILKNKAAIETARGERTFITGSDADVHAINGDSGNAPPGDPANARPRTCQPVITASSCWDGALGHLVNAVNWAGSGRGLGIVSLVAAEYPGAMWWVHPDSFLRAELQGRVTVFWDRDKKRENNPLISAVAQRYPLNYGLTSKGLGNWKNSFHAGISRSIPGYAAIVESTLDPHLAVAIATATFASAAANGPPPAAGSSVRSP